MSAPVILDPKDFSYIRALLKKEPWHEEVGKGPQPMCNGVLQFDSDLTHSHCIDCGRIGRWMAHPHPTTPRHQELCQLQKEAEADK